MVILSLNECITLKLFCNKLLAIVLIWNGKSSIFNLFGKTVILWVPSPPSSLVFFNWQRADIFYVLYDENFYQKIYFNQEKLFQCLWNPMSVVFLLELSYFTSRKNIFDRFPHNCLWWRTHKLIDLGCWDQ